MKKLSLGVKKTFNAGKFPEILILSILFLLPFYFIKLKYSWVSLNLIEILIVVLFLVWILNKEKKYTIHNTQYTIPAVLIIIGLLLSILANKNYYVGLGILKGWFVLPMIFAFIFYDRLKKNEKLLSWSLWALFYSGVLLSIGGIYYWFSGLLTYDGRLRIFYDSPNQLAMFLAPVFLIGIIKFNFEEFRQLVCRKGKVELWKLTGATLGLIFILFNLYLTKSYGAWIAIAVAITIVFWLKYSKKWRRATLIIFLVMLVVIFSWVGISKYKNIERLGARSSLASREMIWKSAGLMIKDNPLFGIGPGNFQNKYLEYQKYFPPYLEWAVPQPHNLFLAFWLEAGLTGLAGFIFLLIQFFRDNKKAILVNREAALVCLGIILYFVFHGLVDTTYWRNDMAVIFWTMLTINLFLAERKTTS